MRGLPRGARVGLVAVLVVAAGGYVWWQRRAAAIDRAAVHYRTQPLERGEIIQTVTANGALRAVQTVEVGSEVSGKIVELMADFNSEVTNGQVLARLDASSFERQLEQADAEVESTRASLGLAEANFRRAKELREIDLVSQADYDQSEAALAQARAAVRMREANLSKVRVDLEKTTVYSPMDGVVISRAVDVGQTVAASLNAPTLYSLARDLRRMRIEAEISEADVGGVEEKQMVTFTVDAYPMRTFTGTVSQVRFQPVTVQNVVNYIAIVDVENTDLKLRPGMTANASVVTARRENVLRLPNSALRFRPAAGAAVPSSDAPSVDPGANRPAGGEGRGPPDGAMRTGMKARPGTPSAGTTVAAARTIHVLDGQGILRAKSVSLGVTDGTWTEVLGEDVSEGALIVTGVLTDAEKDSAARAAIAGRLMSQPPPPR